jgi:hypothetical protein
MQVVVDGIHDPARQRHCRLLAVTTRDKYRDEFAIGKGGYAPAHQLLPGTILHCPGLDANFAVISHNPEVCRVVQWQNFYPQVTTKSGE